MNVNLGGSWIPSDTLLTSRPFFDKMGCFTNILVPPNRHLCERHARWTWGFGWWKMAVNIYKWRCLTRWAQIKNSKFFAIFVRTYLMQNHDSHFLWLEKSNFWHSTLSIHLQYFYFLYSCFFLILLCPYLTKTIIVPYSGNLCIYTSCFFFIQIQYSIMNC